MRDSHFCIAKEIEVCYVKSYHLPPVLRMSREDGTMQIFSSYKVRIAESNQKISRVFIDTLELYRRATDYFIERIREHWGSTFVQEMPEYKQIKATEELCIRTKDRPDTPYDFSREFYKFPSYLRRAAISHAYGAVSSYMTRLETWTENRHGNAPGLPRAGKICPPLYRKNMFVRDKNNNLYRARIKVFIRNTWDWIEVKLRKSDVDYLERYCSHRTEHVPTLCRQNKKVWSLAFAFSEEVELKPKKTIDQQTIVSVDLGINSACVCSAMLSDGTIIGRHFLELPSEEDSLEHALGKIRNAQRHGARKMPGLWALAKGINKAISIKTARFIIEVALQHSADAIVMEYLDFHGKRYRQRLHMWKARYVQEMVTARAHRNGMRISRVCARNTSKLAYDGSGRVRRDKDNYSMCTFRSMCKLPIKKKSRSSCEESPIDEYAGGKRYNCDLSASYNIGARYFIREILKSVDENQRRDILAKVPECSHRSTCTLDSLIRPGFVN